MKDIVSIVENIHKLSPFAENKTEEIMSIYYSQTRNAPRYLCKSQKAVLEIGTSWGVDLHQYGPGSVDLESDKERVDFMRAIGLSAIYANIDDGFPQLFAMYSFDAIVIIGTIEHLHSPRNVLLQSHFFLKEDGLLFAGLPVVPPATLGVLCKYLRKIKKVAA